MSGINEKDKSEWDWKPIDQLGDVTGVLVRGLWQPQKEKVDGEEGVEKKSQNLELNVGVGLGHR